MSRGVFDRLATTAERRDTLLCVGLDPRIGPGEQDPADAIVETNRRIIEATAEYALAFKPNIAFYEQHGPAGLEALSKTVELIPDDVFTILDAKRGDIGSTAEAYAVAAFEAFEADLVTISPYLGSDSADPFLRYDDRGVFVLCRTSNPSAAQVQDLLVTDSDGPTNPEALYVETARRIVSWGEAVGLVVAGNDSAALGRLRAQLPRTWFLAPGIGAQGGGMAGAVEAGIDDRGLGLVPVVARAIANDPDPATAARRFRDEIRVARDKRVASSVRGTDTVDGIAAGERGRRGGREDELVPPAGKLADSRGRGWLRDAVVRGLFELECFQLGEFTLKSGQKSPFYVDLRRAVASPRFMRLLATAYASLVEDLEYDRIAGIPVAALPIATALSLHTGRPMIYPRIPPKPHGTGRPVEGAYRRGERVLLVDDLITTGGSKLEAAEVLESEGLIVNDLAVMLERGRQGREDVQRRGIALHAYLGIEELLRHGVRLGLVEPRAEDEVSKFIAPDAE